MQTNVITLEEIAEELGVTKRHAARKCRLLTENEGFPRQLPGVIGRYSRAQVEAWFASGGRAPALAPVETPPALDPVTIARQSLEGRYVIG